jgi:hypothetical protein
MEVEELADLSLLREANAINFGQRIHSLIEVEGAHQAFASKIQRKTPFWGK